MRIRALMQILSLYDEQLEVVVITTDSLRRDTTNLIMSISEKYDLEGGDTLEVDCGTLNIHIQETK